MTDVVVKDLVITDKLYGAFNDIQRKVFDLFGPTGSADAHYHIDVIQGQDPDDSLEIDFRDVAGTFKYFPVPMTNCSGRIRWGRQKTDFNLEQGLAYGGNVSVAG